MPELGAENETPKEPQVKPAVLGGEEAEGPEESDGDVKKHRIKIGNRAIDVITSSANNVKPEFLQQAAAGSIAREIIAGIDPLGRKFDTGKFEALDEEGKILVAVELIRAVGLEDFKTSFGDYFKKSAKKLVEKLIRTGLGAVVARYLPDFAGNQNEREGIALLLMKENQGFRVAANRKLFGNLRPEISKLVEDYL